MQAVRLGRLRGVILVEASRCIHWTAGCPPAQALEVRKLLRGFHHALRVHLGNTANTMRTMVSRLSRLRDDACVLAQKMFASENWNTLDCDRLSSVNQLVLEETELEAPVKVPASITVAYILLSFQVLDDMMILSRLVSTILNDHSTEPKVPLALRIYG